MTARITATLLFVPLAGLHTLGAASPDDGGPGLAGNAVLGAEFQVNTYTTDSQWLPAVSVDPAGNFVVVWESYGSAENDTAGGSIQGQRLDPEAAGVGGQFEVNYATAGTQGYPAVAATGVEEFAVAWQSPASFGDDTGTASVQFQRFDSIGQLVGSDFQVNTYTTGSQSNPDLAFDAGGGFVVVWGSNGSAASDDSGRSIQGQRLAANGLPTGDEFQVNDWTTGRQDYPAVAVDSSGHFVVVWASENGSPDDDWSIRARTFEVATGNPVGTEFQVNVFSTSIQSRPAVADRGDGTFVVVWQSYGSAGDDSSSYSVQGRLMNFLGPVGDEFQVNTYTMSYQSWPAVSSDRKGNFVVVWQSQGSNGTDSLMTSIQNRQFDSLARPFSEETQVNSVVAGIQETPAIAAGDQNALVAWGSGIGAAGDADGAIEARRIVIHPIFADGFESSQFCRWSVPICV